MADKRAALDRDPDLSQTNAALASMTALARVRWGFEVFGDGLAFTSSFGAMSAGLCHLVSASARARACIFWRRAFISRRRWRFAMRWSHSLGSRCAC